MTTNANRTSTPTGGSVAYELDHSWNPIDYPWLVRVGLPYVAFSLMVGTAVLFHRHLYLHQIDSHSSWPKVIYVAFQVGLAPFLTLNIGQLTKDKIGHKAWEVLLPATLNITFFWLVFEIYVRSLPVGTTSDARVRTWAFFLVLFSGGLIWIQTFFSYFHRRRNPIPAFPLTIENVVFGLITGLVMGFAAPERLAAFRW